MYFHSQFETFDPKTGEIPGYPFTYLPEIAIRARSILSLRSTEQITLIAQKIDDLVQGYFEDEKYWAIKTVREKIDAGLCEQEEYFEWDGGTLANGNWLFKEEMLDEMDVPTPQNTSEVDALKNIIEKRDSWLFWKKGDAVPEECPEGKDYEFFAVLSLWQVADALETLTTNRSKHSTAIAADYAIKAIDAVCHAEHLREVEFSVHYAKTTKEKEIVEVFRRQQVELQQQIKQERSANAKALNVHRHTHNHAAKHLVLEEWEKDPSAFFSTEKAGLHFADWLETKGFQLQPRTVTSWIRSHAKQKGIRLR